MALNVAIFVVLVALVAESKHTCDAYERLTPPQAALCASAFRTGMQRRLALIVGLGLVFILRIYG